MSVVQKKKKAVRIGAQFWITPIFFLEPRRAVNRIWQAICREAVGADTIQWNCIALTLSSIRKLGRDPDTLENPGPAFDILVRLF